MFKLIASDVDGTLIPDSTPDLYPEMEMMIRELKKRNVLFCAASGRQYASLCSVFRNVFEDIAYIAENGAHIRFKNKDISVTAMKRQDVEDIMQMLRMYYGEVDTILSTPNGSIVETNTPEFLDLITNGYHNQFRQVKDVLAEDVPIIKIAVRKKGSIRELGEKNFIPQWKERVKVCVAGEEWVDFMNPTVDKGNALCVLENYLGIKKEETIAFGDNNNDTGMMRAAGLSYAVDTAVPDVKRAADRICPGYRQKGVYTTLKELILEGIV